MISERWLANSDIICLILENRTNVVVDSVKKRIRPLNISCVNENTPLTSAKSRLSSRGELQTLSEVWVSPAKCRGFSIIGLIAFPHNNNKIFGCFCLF